MGLPSSRTLGQRSSHQRNASAAKLFANQWCKPLIFCDPNPLVRARILDRSRIHSNFILKFVRSPNYLFRRATQVQRSTEISATSCGKPTRHLDSGNRTSRLGQLRRVRNQRPVKSVGANPHKQCFTSRCDLCRVPLPSPAPFAGRLLVWVLRLTRLRAASLFGRRARLRHI